MAIDTDQSADAPTSDDPIARMAALYEKQGVGTRDTRQARPEPAQTKEAV